MTLSGVLLFPTSNRYDLGPFSTWQFTNKRPESVTDPEFILIFPGMFRSP